MYISMQLLSLSLTWAHSMVLQRWNGQPWWHNKIKPPLHRLPRNVLSNERNANENQPKKPIEKQLISIHTGKQAALFLEEAYYETLREDCKLILIGTLFEGHQN